MQLSAFRMRGFIAAYGEDTGPSMSKTLPIGLRFSSTTVSPILGMFSSFTMILRFGLV